jgi:hypothetical protein
MENIKRYFSNIIITSNNYKGKKLGLTTLVIIMIQLKNILNCIILMFHILYMKIIQRLKLICDILIENSSYSRASLKDRLYKEGLKNVNVNYVVKVKNGWVKKCR